VVERGVIHVLALETPNQAVTVFSSPVPWQTGTVTPTFNGRTRSVRFTVLNSTQIQFDEAPLYGDIIGFFLTPVMP
jgi:hypothetical protein